MANEMMRATIPAEFYDITSPMLLISPVPQFPYAKLVMGSLNASLAMNGDNMALPIPGRDVPMGAYNEYNALKDMELELANPLPAEAIQVVNDFSPAARTPGHVVRYNRARYARTTHTIDSRTVPAGTVIGTTPVAIQSDQVALSIKRFMGPYNSTQSAPNPFAIDYFDASRSLHSFARIVEQYFKFDFDATLDGFAVQLFDSAPTANILWGGGATANNDLSAEGSHPFDWRLLKRAARQMDDNNVPRFRDGKRVVMISPLQEEQLSTDPEYQRLAKTRDDMNPLFKDSYVAGVMDWHIFKSNTLTRSTNSSSVSVHYAQAFGPQAVGWGLGAQRPEIVPNTNDNYKQTLLAMWLAFMALGVLNENFIYSLRTS